MLFPSFLNQAAPAVRAAYKEGFAVIRTTVPGQSRLMMVYPDGAVAEFTHSPAGAIRNPAAEAMRCLARALLSTEEPVVLCSLSGTIVAMYVTQEAKLRHIRWIGAILHDMAMAEPDAEKRQTCLLLAHDLATGEVN